ncbi:MAG: LAGLIDADG family homing endonuclease [Nanoarchaeota archaeon]
MGDMSINDSRREVCLPKAESSALAEFFGILTGDGYINVYRKSDYVIEIAGNKLKDKEYLIGYVTNLSKELFNAQPRYLEKAKQNSVYLRIRSKAIFYFILNNGFKKGKKGRIRAPLWIRSKDIFMNRFVRGLFDTDGCISLKNKRGKKYPVVSITSKSDLLLGDVKRYLDLKRISSYITRYMHKKRNYKHEVITYQLQVNGFKNMDNWFGLIGSSNVRNLNKYALASLHKTKV